MEKPEQEIFWLKKEVGMARHLFFTGEKGVGKSTLVKRIIAGTKGPVGGFFTVKSETVFPGHVSLHLLPLNGPFIPDKQNFLAFCGEAGRETAERFDRLGLAALSGASECGLLVMDELGPHETGATRFREAVCQALDDSVPILGVLQKAKSPFLSEIASHPQVRVEEVTLQNREFLEARILLPVSFD